MEKIVGYDWPGNVRELQNVIERVAVPAKWDKIGVADLPSEVVHSEARIVGLAAGGKGKAVSQTPVVVTGK